MHFIHKYVIFVCFVHYFAESIIQPQDYKYKCTNGNVIEFTRTCNGIIDCADASDESSVLCESLVCPTGTFQCDYGACVRDLSICSRSSRRRRLQPSTTPAYTRSATQSATNCRITELPANGQTMLQGENPHPLRVDDVVPEYGLIKYTCNGNYHLVGSETSYCASGEWSSTVPNCHAKCALRRISSITYVTQCSKKVNGVNTFVTRCGINDLVDPGTSVKIVCEKGYQPVAPHEQITSCQRDGSWSRPVAPCAQICGEEGPSGVPYIVGGEVTNNTRVPWHVGVYRMENDEPSYICGGSILSPKVILSAIHCFWNDLEATIHPEREYRIVAGKFYREFNDPREKNNYQVLNVEKINYPSEYEHKEGLYANDVAVVIVKNHIEYKTHIAPICIDYDLDHDEKVVSAGSVGRVAGWGLEHSGGRLSDTLKVIEIPVINRDQCRQGFRRAFQPFMTSDKFCAGQRNQGVGLCQGDSGGGLVFAKDPFSEKTVYYIRGIVSTGPSHDGSCDSNEYTLFTNTAHFAAFVMSYDYANRPEYVDLEQNTDSTAPTSSNADGTTLKPSTSRAPSTRSMTRKTTTTIVPSTTQRRRMTSMTNTMRTTTTTIAPTTRNMVFARRDECVINFDFSSTKMLDSSGNEVKFGHRVSGTIYFHCGKGLYLRQIAESRCHNGNWIPTIARDPPCLLVFPSLTELSESQCSRQAVCSRGNCETCGIQTVNDHVPWHAAIYVDDKYICSGTILSNMHIVTELACVAYYNVGQLRIVAGSVRPYADEPCPQVTTVRRMEVLAETDKQFALLEIDNQLRYNDFVRSICMDSAVNAATEANSIVYEIEWIVSRDNGNQLKLSLLNVPIASISDCVGGQIPCTLTNVSRENRTSFQGSGLTVAKISGGVSRHYLIGIGSNVAGISLWRQMSAIVKPFIGY